jgi:uncharacterized protein (DUF4415 family)
MASEDIRSYSANELRAMRANGLTKTRKDAPEYPIDETFWDTAKLVDPVKQNKAHISMRVDADVLDWYRSQGDGYLSRMNAVLRSFMEAHKR